MITSSARCAFCDIVAGTAPASVVYEDDASLAFLDIGAINPGHLLIIPKAHVAGLSDLDEDGGAHLFRVGLRLATALRRSGLRCDGVNVFLADGEAAFQEVFHVHLHVFPRFRGDSFRIDADWSAHPSRGELDEVAARLRAAMTAG